MIPVLLERIQPVTLERTWGTETLIVDHGYVGKVLRYRAGCAGGLQYHRTRTETFHLVSGEALVTSADATGQLVQETMRPGQTFHIPPGAVHQFLAVTDCLVFEVSDGAYADRVRMEAHYGAPVLDGDGGLETTPEPTAREMLKIMANDAQRLGMYD